MKICVVKCKMFIKGEKRYKVLVVVPARGGSKSIKRKNIRFVAGKPLMYYPINAALRSKYVDEVYVTSDDDMILRFVRVLSARVIKRSPELARDDVPLDPVVYHAVNVAESESGIIYDVVVTLQPTVPLVSSEDIDRAIELLVENNYDTVVFAVNATHLYWIQERDSGKWEPLLKIRANRQYLPSIVKELGVVVTWRKYVRENSRFGQHIGIYLLPDDKGIDIDTPLDMMMAETLLQRYSLVFVVDGRRETGLGHIYRSLTLAERFHGHNILFLTNGELGKELISKWGYRVRIVRSYDEIIENVSVFNSNIVINDILNTTEEYMKSLRESTDALIVNFEDLGEGTRYADLVFNALYEFSSPPPNHYYGYKYFILRDEFRLFPIKVYNNNSKFRTLTIIFGGVDLNNLTMRSLNAIETLGVKSININVIVGPGYAYLDDLRDYVDELLRQGYRIELYTSPGFIADIIYESDPVITSNGRTLYEVASFAIPIISIAQNERELKHSFVYVNNGIKFLGLAKNVDVDIIADTIKTFIQKPQLLTKSNRALLPYARDIRRGVKRVIRIILDEVIEYGPD